MIYKGKRYGWDFGDMTPEKMRKEQILIDAKERYEEAYTNPHATSDEKIIALMLEKELFDYNELVAVINSYKVKGENYDFLALTRQIRKGFTMACNIYEYAVIPTEEAKKHIAKMKEFTKEAYEKGILDGFVKRCKFPIRFDKWSNTELLLDEANKSSVGFQYLTDETVEILKNIISIEIPTFLELLDAKAFGKNETIKKRLLDDFQKSAQEYLTKATDKAEAEAFVKKTLKTVLATVEEKEQECDRREEEPRKK